MVWVFLVASSQRKQRAVGLLEHATYVFVENACEIVALAQGVPIGALVLIGGEQINATPNECDYSDAQVGRRLPDRATQLAITGGSQSLAESLSEVSV